MKKFYWLIISFSLVLPISLIAQESDLSSKMISIKGKILDEKNNPMYSASVWVCHPSNPRSIVKGDISMKDGCFKLAVPSNKEYVLNIQMLGYKPVTRKLNVESDDIDNGEFILELKPMEMDVVLVRPPIQMTADRIVYNFEHDPARARSNMLDMIQKMPLIIVDPFDGKIHVESPQKTYIVLRKGRQDAQFAGFSFDEVLKRLPAMGFTTFEIWTVVPPKYEGYDYVINILPDPNQRVFGVIGGTSAEYDAADGKFLLGQGFSVSTGRIRFVGNLGFQNTNAPKSNEKISTLFYETQERDELLITQSTRKQASSEAFNSNFQMSVDISKRQFINLEFKGIITDSRNFALRHVDSLYQGTHTYMDNHALGSSDTKSWGFKATYQLDFNKQSRSLNISYLLNSLPTTIDDRLYVLYDDPALEDRKRLSSSDGQDVSNRVQIDYSDVYGNGKYRLSSRVGYLSKNYDERNNVFDLITNEEFIDDYSRLKQNLERLDGHLGLGWNPLKQLNISSTVKADYLINEDATTATDNNTSVVFNQKSLLIGANGGLRYQFNLKKSENKNADPRMPKLPYNSSLSLNYEYSQARPSVNQLTNYENTLNPLYVTRGNPDLKVESSHSFNLSIHLSTFSPSINYSFSNDMIVRQTVAETNADGTRLVTSYHNAGKKDHLSFSLMYLNVNMMMAQPKPFNFGLYEITSSYSISKIDYGDGTFNNVRILYLRTSWLLSIKRNRISIQLGYIHSESEGVTDVSNNNPFSLTFKFNRRQQIGTNTLTYGMSLGNVLTLKPSGWSTMTMPDYSYESKSSKHRVPVSFSISYNYGKFKVKPIKNAKNSATVDGFSAGSSEQNNASQE